MLRVRKAVQRVDQRQADVSIDNRRARAWFAGDDEDAREIDGGQQFLVELENARHACNHEENAKENDHGTIADAPGDHSPHYEFLFTGGLFSLRPTSRPRNRPMSRTSCSRAGCGIGRASPTLSTTTSTRLPVLRRLQAATARPSTRTAG